MNYFFFNLHTTINQTIFLKFDFFIKLKIRSNHKINSMDQRDKKMQNNEKLPWTNYTALILSGRLTGPPCT